MIPIELGVENFLSYASPEPLDFTGFDVACLTGQNGVGKSSFLDAMTWALFGAARGCEGGQNQDRLIREGTDTTSVEFTFELGETVYRVKRSRTRAGRSELQFVVQAEDGGWTNLAGETLKETDARVGSVLRMDYRTFTSSAFVLQGRADDFLTRMRPEDRKEVFARILDLGVYERLEEAARGRGREAEARRKDLAGRVGQLTERTSDLESVDAALEHAELALADLQAKLGAAEADEEERRRALTGLERTLTLAESERESMARLERRISGDRDALATKIDEMERLDALLSRAAEVGEALRQAGQLREMDVELRRTSEVHSALEKARLEASGHLQTEEKTLRSHCLETQRRLDETIKEADDVAVQGSRLAEVSIQLASLGDVESASQEVRSLLEALRAEDASLSARLGEIDRRRTEVAEKLDLLHSGGGECPLCGGPLDLPHRRKLERSLSEDVRALDTETETVTASRDTVRKDGLRLAEEERRLKRSAVQVQKLRTEEAALAARLERLPQLRDEIAKLTSEVATYEKTLRDETFAQDVRAELQRIEGELESNPYDPEGHEAVRQELMRLREYEQLHGRLEEATNRRAAVESERRELERLVAESEGELVERRRTLERLTSDLESAEGIRQAFERAKANVVGHRKAAAKAAADHARLIERRDTLRKTREELEETVRLERSAAVEHRRYSRLAQAFGRGGIPDRIIDNALPELTAEANDVLGRLTDYEMSLQFALSRPTKTGKIRDTFDVLVHHDGGVREYQMFSGGEAFRIAFAIRMGLSKLLVRRAGARLETLVIDEGFGTQDPEGRERLVEAVNLARQEFRKILVITHLEELKDAFGTQIRVSKHPEHGSTIELMSA